MAKKSPVYSAYAHSIPYWIPVSSSNLEAYHFQFDFHRLYLKFKSGEVYGYQLPGESMFYDFLNAPSKGKFVWYVLRSAAGQRPALDCYGPL